MLCAYLDETGQEEKQWVFMAGYLGNEDQWKQCVIEWKKELGNKKSLHMKELRFKKERDRDLLARLGPIPYNCGLRKVVGGVNVSHYEDLVRGTLFEKQAKGYMACLTPLIVSILQAIPPNEQVEIIFEQQTRYEEPTDKFLNNIQIASMSHPELWQFRTSDGKPKLAKWGFVPKSSLLEPADYLAYAYAQYHRDKNSQRAQWCMPILEEGNVKADEVQSIGKVMTRDEIRSHFLNLEKSVTLSGIPYRDPSEPKPHDTSNLRFRLSQDQIPRLRCPVCSADIDVSGAKYLVPWSICHGWAMVNPPRETLVGTVSFYSERPSI